MSGPPTGDRGQRYEVTFVDPAHGALNRRTLGWSETHAGAMRMAEAIGKHPSWHTPHIIDRKPLESLK